MQQADISPDKETTANASDDDDEEGGGECVVVQESRVENKELKNQMMIPGQVDAVTMEVQQDPGSSTVSGEYNWLPEMLTGLEKIRFRPKLGTLEKTQLTQCHIVPDGWMEKNRDGVYASG